MSRAEDIFQKLIYFGEDALDEFIVNAQSEELFLDFKQAVSTGKPKSGGGAGNALHRDDRKNLAKAISGFGNSEGGVIVWGVECANCEIGDVAQSKVKIKNVHRFLSWMESAISGCTIPSHNTVRNHIISVDKNGDGYLATYIPKSDISPLMSTVGSIIYVRSGSSNVPAPYSVIAGMFGRRPQPNLDLLFAEKHLEVLDNDNDIIYPKEMKNKPKKFVKLGFSLRGNNHSNSIARELYLSCATINTGGEFCKVMFFNYNQVDSIAGIEGQLNIITRPELRLPPRGTFKFTNVQLILSPEIGDDLHIDGVIGAEGTSPKDFRIYAGKNQLRSFVARVIRGEESEEVLLNEFFAENVRYAQS